MINIPENIIDIINSKNTFYIIGHKEPDGDSIGSSLALKYFLEKLGKKAVVLSSGPFLRPETRKYKDLFLDQFPENTDKEALLIIVDCSTFERLGVLGEQAKNFECLVIDHHKPGETDGKYNYIDESSPAVTLMIQKLIKEFNIDLDKNIADMLFFGFLTDSGFFMHLKNDTAEAFNLIADLVAMGCSPKDAYYKINGNKSFESRQFTSHTTKRARPYFNNKFILSVNKLRDTKKYGAKNRDSDAVYKMLLSVENCKSVALINQKKSNYYTIGLRSTDSIDVSSIAESFGGGGHKNASGFAYKGKLSKLKKELIRKFDQILNN